MATPIYINVASAAEGADLARSLARHGLMTGVIRSDERWRVEVRSPGADLRDLLATLGIALAARSRGERQAQVEQGDWCSDGFYDADAELTLEGDPRRRAAPGTDANQERR